MYATEFLNHLHFPVAYDIFITVLEALSEFIQGPNKENQNILVQRNFVELSNQILLLKYEEKDMDHQKTKKRGNTSTSHGKSSGSFRSLMKSVDKSRSNKSVSNTSSRGTMSRTKLEDFKMIAYKNEITQPRTNFMMSLVKFKISTILLQMLVTQDYKDYVYYLLRRVLDPEVFRMNFAYS
mmetsp:Transcript_1642/g.2027  ORF Transcript_1642/g.2027 Transcript_1642/m.2027 type:complete len:181 (+) Transcript_1642:1030-1572(+)